ncbi:MAG: phage recombination protein Bet [Nitrosomonas sp.]|nr:phage recombination protein Bet [Nitrosomonas sp.]
MSASLQSLQINEEDLFKVLSNSLYVGAQPESIKMVISYCAAAKLDPMLKPVNIVPMFCATGQKDQKGYDIKAMRDVVMPGIGLYRIQASRSGEFAGTSEPEFGNDITETLDGAEITYPAWCKVTVKRLLSNGVVAEFTAKEFWKENYATKVKDSKAPNTMWAKRPYAQIAKCAEAQALRKAFPEVGSQPTADEMEGKEIDITPSNPSLPAKKELITLDQESFDKKSIVWKKTMIEKNETAKSLIAFLQNKYLFTEDQIETIKSWESTNANS